MHVLHWYPSFTRGGGVANIVLNLAAAQSALGARVTIASLDQPAMYGAPPLAPEVELLTWTPSWRIARGGIVLDGVPGHVAGRLAAVEPDVVHVHGEFNPDNWWVPRVFDAPVVLSPHGAFHPGVFEKHARRRKTVYVKVASRMLYRKVALLHAVSPMEMRQLAGALPDLPAYCAPQGTSVPLDDPSSAPASAADGPRSLLFIGRLDPYTKGLDLLVDAYAAAVERLAPVPLRLTMVGPDWNGGRKVVEDRSRAAGIHDGIELPGAVSSAELARLLPRFDCYVQLSRHESFGFGVADALALGTPVVMTSSMGIASFDELACLPHVRVVDPDPAPAAEAIVDVIRQLDRLAPLALAARPGVRSFLSWARIADIHLREYDGLVTRVARRVDRHVA